MADEAENARPKGLLILFTSLKLLNILNDTEFRRVVNAMAAYVESGTEPDGLEPIEQLAFESQREALDGNIQAYQKTATANRENGKKGGRPRKAIKTDGFSEKPTETDGFLCGQIPADEKTTETHKNQKLRIKNYTDTKVSDTTTVVVNKDSVDTDLARIIQHYEAVAGSFPRSALEKLQSWRELYSTEMILLAIDKAAEAGKRSWTYINGILSNWKKEDVRTPGDVDASDENHKRQQARSGRSPWQPAESVDDQLTRVLANMDRKRGFEG